MKAAKKRHFKKTPECWKILQEQKPRYNTRMLSASWTIEQAKDLMATYAIDEDELVAIFTAEINK